MKNESVLTIVDGGPDKSAVAPKSRQKPKPSPSKDRPAKALPSPRLAFSNQLEMLRGYAAASGPANNPVATSEVADIVKVAESSFSLVQPFFCEIGLLQRIEQAGQAWKYLPSVDVFNFAKAHEWNRETAGHKLAPVISASWFAEPLLRKLSFQPLDENEAIATLAEKASAGPDYKAHLRLLVNYMETAGLIQRENGKVKMIKSSLQPSGNDLEEPATADPKSVPTVRSSAISTAFAQPTQGVVNFHVDVKINMDEFAHWSPARIAALFSGIAQVLAAKGGLEKEAGAANGN
jgi:hypothetical protein